MALLLAVILGIFAMFAVLLTLKKKEALLKQGVMPIRVALAVDNVPAGKELKLDHIQWAEVPKAIYESMGGELISGEKELEKYLGKKVLREIKSGEYLFRYKLTNPDEVETKDLNDMVSRGMRAISIGVDFPQGVSGLLKPGYHVDVLASFEIEIKGFGKYEVTATIVRDREILAIDSYTQVESELSPRRRRALSEYSSVTLMVRPEEAELLAHAHQFGNLHLAFRRKRDKIRSTPAVDVYSIVGRTNLRIKQLEQVKMMLQPKTE